MVQGVNTTTFTMPVSNGTMNDVLKHFDFRNWVALLSGGHINSNLVTISAILDQLRPEWTG